MKELLIKEAQKQALLKHCGYDMVRARKFILAKASLREEKLLEIGTGKGHFTRALARRGLIFTSIDLDDKPQKLAREYLRLDQLTRQVRIMQMNAENLQFCDQAFEAVISVNFMHHARRPSACIREMVRVAKTKIVIADINKQGEKVLERVHALEGHKHARSRTTFLQMRAFLLKRGFRVRIFKGFCQTILVAEKEG